MTNPNGELPPAPPPPTRLGLEGTVTHHDTEKLNREVRALQQRLLHLENALDPENERRHGLYVSLTEMATAVLAVQKDIRSLRQDLRDLHRRVSDVEVKL